MRKPVYLHSKGGERLEHVICLFWSPHLLVSDLLKFPDKNFSKEYPNNIRCGCRGQSSLKKIEGIVTWKTMAER